MSGTSVVRIFARGRTPLLLVGTRAAFWLIEHIQYSVVEPVGSEKSLWLAVQQRESLHEKRNRKRKGKLLEPVFTSAACMSRSESSPGGTESHVGQNVGASLPSSAVFGCVSIQCLHPSEEHLKADYVTTPHKGSSRCPCFWRMHCYNPSQIPISQDSLRTRKRRKKARKWRHHVA